MENLGFSSLYNPGPLITTGFRGEGGSFQEQGRRVFKRSPRPAACNPPTEASIPTAIALPLEGHSFATLGPWHLSVEKELTAGFPGWEEEPSQTAGHLPSEGPGRGRTGQGTASGCSPCPPEMDSEPSWSGPHMSWARRRDSKLHTWEKGSSGFMWPSLHLLICAVGDRRAPGGGPSRTSQKKGRQSTKHGTRRAVNTTGCPWGWPGPGGSQPVFQRSVAGPDPASCFPPTLPGELCSPGSAQEGVPEDTHGRAARWLRDGASHPEAPPP